VSLGRGTVALEDGPPGALLRSIARGTLDPGRLVSRTISLDNAGAELAAMTEFAQRGVTVITELR
jgi:hypothetical protein